MIFRHKRKQSRFNDVRTATALPIGIWLIYFGLLYYYRLVMSIAFGIQFGSKSSLKFNWRFIYIIFYLSWMAGLESAFGVWRLAISTYRKKLYIYSAIYLVIWPDMFTSTIQLNFIYSTHWMRNNNNRTWGGFTCLLILLWDSTFIHASENVYGIMDRDGKIPLLISLNQNEVIALLTIILLRIPRNDSIYRTPCPCGSVIHISFFFVNSS